MMSANSLPHSNQRNLLRRKQLSGLEVGLPADKVWQIFDEEMLQCLSMTQESASASGINSEVHGLIRK